ncbi:MAG: hypothetical protein SV253_07505 [Halobacteria archaeon]|nr:hypothetical protein [Halobacteria archaeon]
MTAGGVFEFALSLLSLSIEGIGEGILFGAVYGLVLLVVGMLFWMRLILGVKVRAKIVGMSLFFHLVYGVVHGAWAGLGVIG